MSVTHTPPRVHIEFDVDAYRLMHLVLGAVGIAFLVVVLFMPTQNIYAAKTFEATPQSSTASVDEKKYSPAPQSFSAESDAGITSEADQPYYIASPDL